MGRHKSTGRYETRAELEEEVRGWVRINNSFQITARIVGVSAATVSNIYYSPKGHDDAPDHSS